MPSTPYLRRLPRTLKRLARRRLSLAPSKRSLKKQTPQHASVIHHGDSSQRRIEKHQSELGASVALSRLQV